MNKISTCTKTAPAGGLRDIATTAARQNAEDVAFSKEHFLKVCIFVNMIYLYYMSVSYTVMGYMSSLYASVNYFILFNIVLIDFTNYFYVI